MYSHYIAYYVQVFLLLQLYFIYGLNFEEWDFLQVLACTALIIRTPLSNIFGSNCVTVLSMSYGSVDSIGGASVTTHILSTISSLFTKLGITGSIDIGRLMSNILCGITLLDFMLCSYIANQFIQVLSRYVYSLFCELTSHFC